MKDVWENLLHQSTSAPEKKYFLDIEKNPEHLGEGSSNSILCPPSPGDGANNSSTQDLGKEEMLHLDKRCKKKSPHATRLVRKGGGINVKVSNIEDKGERYALDFFTTLVDVKWRWTLAYFTISYVLSWFLFAIAWWVIVRAHGDMDHFEEEGWKPCIVGVRSFKSIFLFSLETQHTIGYGYHRMSDECEEAIFLLIVQSILGVIIESLTVGVFIVKLSRSKKRAQTVVFSKNAVICMKDGGLAFIFRVADVGKSMLLEAHVRAQLITKTLGKSGKVLLCQKTINLEADDQDDDRLLLFWPTTIYHTIDEESPMYAMNPDHFKKSFDSHFEILVVLEGIVESTGMTTQARTSYISSEILWGQSFLNLLHSGVKYTANMELFHITFPVPEMPLYSAKELKEIENREKAGSQNSNET